MARNTGGGSRAAAEHHWRTACGGQPHDAIPVESVLTGETVAHICQRCLEGCRIPSRTLVTTRATTPPAETDHEPEEQR